jgi:hypothetical protein
MSKTTSFTKPEGVRRRKHREKRERIRREKRKENKRDKRKKEGHYGHFTLLFTFHNQEKPFCQTFS